MTQKDDGMPHPPLKEGYTVRDAPPLQTALYRIALQRMAAQAAEDRLHAEHPEIGVAFERERMAINQAQRLGARILDPDYNRKMAEAREERRRRRIGWRGRLMEDVRAWVRWVIAR